ncbi:MAG: cell division protein ZapA [Rhizobacter sp.]|nr:cell division protein ZapA [Rhizobacter sp.]
MKQIEVTILGQSYLLGCPEGGEVRLMEAVARVDREMTAIREAGKVKARERIAVLAALNLAYALTEKPVAAPRAASADAADGSESQASPGDLEALIRRVDEALQEAVNTNARLL